MMPYDNIHQIGNDMLFYDSTHKAIKISVEEKISSIYNTHHTYKTQDGKVLKKYRISKICDDIFSPDLAIDKLIQSLELPNFYQIEEYLFDAQGIYSGIIMPYYQSTKENLLLKPSDYLTDNFRGIFRSFSILASNLVETADAHIENVIFTDDEIIIIDSERYQQYESIDISYLRKENYERAQWILYKTLVLAAKNHNEFINTNFNYWFNHTAPTVEEIFKELSQVKYPIEYLRKIKNKIK